MKIINRISFFVFVMFNCIGISQTIDSLYEVATWPGFKQGAVSFTFDDNCANQLSIVMPMFDQFDFKMTFYSVINWGPNWSALQAAASNGHEVGSHTVSHANLGSLTDNQQITELKNSQDVINSHIISQKCLTIAYPNCVEGNPDICSQYYIAARGCSGQIVPKTPPDFMNISSFVCGSQGSVQRASDFENSINAAVSSNGWVVFLIHAIDNESGYSPTNSAEIKIALEYLNQNKEKIWESTFGNVVRYIKERNEVSIKELSVKDSLITFCVNDTLDNSIYNYPLTIRRSLPQGWTSATISQNGKTLNSQVVTINSKNYILFDVIPDSGNIQMEKETPTDVLGNLKSQISTPFLMQNFPNPFNPTTVISFQLPKSEHVSLKVYDELGREIAVLVDEQKSAGFYNITFNGYNLASGIYLCKLIAGNFTDTKKLMLLK